MWTFWKDRFIMYVSTANFKFYYRFAKKKKRERRKQCIWFEKKAYGICYVISTYSNSEYLEPNDMDFRVQTTKILTSNFSTHAKHQGPK